MTPENAAPKPRSRRQSEKNDAFFEKIFKSKITSAKNYKICWQITVAALMQPLQSDLRCPAAKETSITHAAAAPTSCSKPASLYALGNTRWQQSCCSHSNAICNRRFKTRKELRTQEQPLVAEHRRGTHYARNDASRTLLHLSTLLTWQHQMTTTMQPFQCDLQPQIPKHA